MKKFIALLKKEIRELLTLQMILPLFLVVIAFSVVGKFAEKEIKKSMAPQPIAVVDRDRTATSEAAIRILSAGNFKIDKLTADDVEMAISEAKEKKERAVVVIPPGFEKGINSFTPQKLEVYTLLTNLSATSARDAGFLAAGISALNDGLSSKMISTLVPGKDPAQLKRPISSNDFVIIGDKRAGVSPLAVAAFVTSQTTFIPIVLFLVIVMAAQMIAVSIASEKENKTLETLLSSPVSRRSIVASKLVAAGFVALVMAGIYLVGMKNYYSNLIGPAGSASLSESVVAQLGLAFSTADYLMLGLVLFFGILAALALAFIMGSFAQDVKSAQGVIAPLMLIVLIPYLLTLFLDFSALSTTARFLIYAIPFSHPFLAVPNILLGNLANVWYGIAYLAFFFLVSVFISAKIFSSEKIFTLRLGFKKRRG